MNRYAPKPNHRSTRRRRALRLLAAGLPLMALTMACTLFDGSDDVPVISRCSAPSAGDDLDSFEMEARHTTGGQGLEMITLDFVWRGDSFLQCSPVHVTVYDAPGGVVFEEVEYLLQTRWTEGSGDMVADAYVVMNVRDEVWVEASAFGMTATQKVCRWSVCEDAGPEFDGGDPADSGADAGDL